MHRPWNFPERYSLCTLNPDFFSNITLRTYFQNTAHSQAYVSVLQYRFIYLSDRAKYLAARENLWSYENFLERPQSLGNYHKFQHNLSKVLRVPRIFRALRLCSLACRVFAIGKLREPHAVKASTFEPSTGELKLWDLKEFEYLGQCWRDCESCLKRRETSSFLF